MTRWVTIDKAASETGFTALYFHERTGTGGCWPEGPVWKWFDGRKLVDLDALYRLIDQRPSTASQRGRRKAANQSCPQQNAQAA